MRLAITILLGLSVSACDGPKPTPAPEPTPAPTFKPPAPKQEPKSAVIDATADNVVKLEGSDTMRFNAEEIRVSAGKKVKLTLTHTGKMAAANMGHNFILLKSGVDMEKFSLAASKAADKGYVASEDDVLAHTKLIGGGESVDIEFDAPEPGTYDFLCSFPGHYALMKGKFIVT